MEILGEAEIPVEPRQSSDRRCGVVEPWRTAYDLVEPRRTAAISGVEDLPDFHPRYLNFAKYHRY